MTLEENFKYSKNNKDTGDKNIIFKAIKNKIGN